MSGEVEVYPSGMRRTGDSLSDLSVRLRTEWAAHAERVAAMGDVFGDDPVSSLIGASYQAAHQIAEQSYQSVAASLASFGRAAHVLRGALGEHEGGILDEDERSPFMLRLPSPSSQCR